MKRERVKLGVNIDHVASLRQARGTPYPDMAETARRCERAGASGITVHLREDRRHIQDRDVYALRESVNVPLNLEMANNPGIVKIALDVKPDEVCLVPERREELTTEGGLNVEASEESIRRVTGVLAEAGIRVSLFIDPEESHVRSAARCGAEYVELHTGEYCHTVDGMSAGRKKGERKRELGRLIDAANIADAEGLRVNAGHGISIRSVEGVLEVPHLDTLNIGHSIICRSVFLGIEAAVREMVEKMEEKQKTESRKQK
ncbi:MAG: pyridoxine 5'-phosphate synthase [Kiritimatiellia bacterium]